jgi:hypothetical protein
MMFTRTVVSGLVARLAVAAPPSGGFDIVLALAVGSALGAYRGASWLAASLTPLDTVLSSSCCAPSVFCCLWSRR